MNPYEENLKNLIEDHITEPSELSGVEDRFDKRFRKERRNSRIKISSAVTSLLVLFMFITANTDTAWAESLKKIPVLKELLSSMAFLDDHKDQIEELGLVSDNGEHQLYLQYALSDDKQISLYVQFPDYIKLDQYDQVMVEVIRAYDLKTDTEFTDSFIPTSDIGEHFQNNYLNLFGMLSPGQEQRYPEELGIVVSATIYRRTFSPDSGMSIDGVEDLGHFAFETHLQKMSSRNNMDINQGVVIEGNELIIKSVESSSLVTSVLFQKNDANTHRFADLKGKIENPETGEILSDGLGMTLYDFDSNIYAVILNRNSLAEDAHTVNFVITEVSLVDKTKEKIFIDFDQKTMSTKMDGAELSMISSGSKSTFTLKLPYEEPGVMYSPFQFMYETDDGDKKPLPYPNLSGHEEFYTVSYVFDEEINGTITLTQSGQTPGHYIKLDEPIEISIDIPERFNPNNN